MIQKGFINIIVIIVIVILAGVTGYFVVSQRTSSLTPTPSSTSDTTEYPYILKPLSQNQLTSLRSEFETSNKNICAKISEYGFTERKMKYGKNGCNGETIRIEITDEISIVEMVKNWLVQNSKFTGITKESDLIVDNVRKFKGCIECEPPNFDRKVIGLQIFFRGQTYNGLPIEGDLSPLAVFANAKGISEMEGNFFPMMTIPIEPKISEASAKNKINGRTFTYSDMAGNPRNYRVEQKNLSNVAHKIVFVKKSSQGLEFRLAWKIFLGQGLPWTVYVDAVTGEELKVVQMFQT